MTTQKLLTKLKMKKISTFAILLAILWVSLSSCETSSTKVSPKIAREVAGDYGVYKIDHFDGTTKTSTEYSGDANSKIKINIEASSTDVTNAQIFVISNAGGLIDNIYISIGKTKENDRTYYSGTASNEVVNYDLLIENGKLELHLKEDNLSLDYYANQLF